MKRKILLALLAASALTSVAQIPAQQKTVVLKSNQGVTTRGAQDPNIKQGVKLNDLNHPAPTVKKKNNVTRGGAPSIELKSSQGEAGALDSNIAKDDSLNDKNHPQKKN